MLAYDSHAGGAFALRPLAAIEARTLCAIKGRLDCADDHEQLAYGCVFTF
jgi:hypothetical protein